ncbi:hypothetical protein HMPREF1549_02621 [Actinomyces johnsonii F0510]|uniref:Uncharacterized protein n=1 Tax=Actinomyces johnsonii F0510 TaxID=1227262 RepID=U1Q0K1_9ACTO|nr:hypothetical protein HMPREF1549_02621 [Actinomyces johnsonii F0510]
MRHRLAIILLAADATGRFDGGSGWLKRQVDGRKLIDAIKADKVQRSGSRDPNLNLERRSAYHNPVAFERQAGNIPCRYLAGCVV